MRRTETCTRLVFLDRVVDPTGHKSGGHPIGIGARNRPYCRSCRRPLHLILQLDVTDPDLRHLELSSAGECTPRRAARHLFVMTCLNCDSYYRPLHYALTPAGKCIRVHAQGPGTSFGDRPDALPERGVRLVEARPDRPDAGELLHQIGGDPLWMADEATPCCSRGHGAMRFLAQLDSDPDRGLRFGDMGLLYAFCCALCGEIATLVQDA